MEEEVDSSSSKQKSKDSKKEESSISSSSSSNDDVVHSKENTIITNGDIKIKNEPEEEGSHSDNDHEDIELPPLGIDDIPTIPWYRGSNDRKLVVMMVLTLGMMVAELFVGFKTGSLALIGDGFHMASDGISLVIAFAAIQMSKRSTTVHHTYGWQRSEVIGSFVNGMFLVSVSLIIALEAIQRFVILEEVKDPLQVVYVGCGGVFTNVVGLIMFADKGGHGHSHGGGGGHGHSHGGGHGHENKGDHKDHDNSHGHSHDGNKKKKHHDSHGHSHDEKKKKKEGHSHDEKHDDKHDHKHDHKHDKHDHKHDKHDHKHDKHDHKHDKHDHKHDHKHDKHDNKLDDHDDQHDDHKHDKHDHNDHSHDESDSAKTPMIRKARNDNIRAVFLHILGDFLASLAAIASGLLIQFLTFEGRFYFDPALSLFIVLLILRTSVPIVRRCILVFMQTVPNFLDVTKLKEDLIKVPGVISMHELHVWTLVENKTIGSVHITCLDYADFMIIAKKMKKIFHKHQVHSTTIQPEFIKEKVFKRKRERCQLSCLKEENCKTDSCCPPTYDDALGEGELIRYIEETKPRRRFRKQHNVNVI